MPIPLCICGNRGIPWLHATELPGVNTKSCSDWACNHLKCWNDGELMVASELSIINRGLMSNKDINNILMQPFDISISIYLSNKDISIN